MPIQVQAVSPTNIPPLTMPDRFRQEILYFASQPETQPIPGEYHLSLGELQKILDDGCFSLVSPLDSAARAEIEITDDQERWLEWVCEHQITRVRFA